MNVRWTQVASGSPMEIIPRLQTLAGHYREGDYGAIRLELRSPLPGEWVSWLDAQLKAATRQIRGTVTQVGRTLEIPFQIGAVPLGAIAAVLLGAAAFVLAWSVGVSVWRGEPILPGLDPEGLKPVLLVGVGLLLIWALLE